MPVIGFLSSRSPSDRAHLVAAFHRALNEDGLCRGSERRDRISLGGNQYERLPALAADLGAPSGGRDRRDGGTPAPGGKAATATIPIVFTMGGDPVS